VVAHCQKRNDLRLVAVVLGSQHKLTNFKEASEMLSQGFLNYEMHPIAKKGASIRAIGAISDADTAQYQAGLGQRRRSVRKRVATRKMRSKVDTICRRRLAGATQSGPADRIGQCDRKAAASRHIALLRAWPMSLRFGIVN